MQQDKVEQARHLYFAQAKTQKEIAQMLDVTERTIYNWIRRYAWDKMREAARQAPALISENLCSQIVELQNSIGRREPGLRYATAEESLIMQRLITMLDKMKRYVGLSMNMQIIGNFRNWASTRDKNFARDLGLYSGLFLQGYAQNGYYPYELEFGMDKINPIDPYYQDEPLEEKPKPTEKEVIVNRPNDAIMSMSNNVIVSPPNDEKAEKPEPEKSHSEQTQTIESHSTYNDNNTFSPPEKTGKTPATPDRSNAFPWRNHLLDINSFNVSSASKPKQDPESK